MGRGYAAVENRISVDAIDPVVIILEQRAIRIAQLEERIFHLTRIDNEEPTARERHVLEVVADDDSAGKEARSGRKVHF